MALSNSQYNEVMRGYERRQMENRHGQQRRRQEVYARVPQMEALDQAVGARAAACAFKALQGAVTRVGICGRFISCKVLSTPLPARKSSTVCKASANVSING